MLIFHNTDRLFLYSGSVDMRKGFDGLCGLVTNDLGRNPLDGDWYVFINKGRNRIKILKWENDGFAIFYKRLERGTLELPKVDSSVKSISLSSVQLQMILHGISLEQRINRKRYSTKTAFNV